MQLTSLLSGERKTRSPGFSNFRAFQPSLKAPSSGFSTLTLDRFEPRFGRPSDPTPPNDPPSPKPLPPPKSNDPGPATDASTPSPTDPPPILGQPWSVLGPLMRLVQSIPEDQYVAIQQARDVERDLAQYRRILDHFQDLTVSAPDTLTARMNTVLDQHPAVLEHLRQFETNLAQQHPLLIPGTPRLSLGDDPHQLSHFYTHRYAPTLLQTSLDDLQPFVRQPNAQDYARLSEQDSMFYLMDLLGTPAATLDVQAAPIALLKLMMRLHYGISNPALNQSMLRVERADDPELQLALEASPLEAALEAQVAPVTQVYLDSLAAVDTDVDTLSALISQPRTAV